MHNFRGCCKHFAAPPLFHGKRTYKKTPQTTRLYRLRCPFWLRKAHVNLRSTGYEHLIRCRKRLRKRSKTRVTSLFTPTEKEKQGFAKMLPPSFADPFLPVPREESPITKTAHKPSPVLPHLRLCYYQTTICVGFCVLVEQIGVCELKCCTVEAAGGKGLP